MKVEAFSKSDQSQDSQSIESTENQLVPYNHRNNSNNNEQALACNVCLPQLYELVTFTNNKSFLDKTIDQRIDYDCYSPLDIATFKQYICNQVETTFKFPNETCEEATLRCFKPGMFFLFHSTLEKYYKLVWFRMGI